MSKKMWLFPIYWGEWWVPAKNNAYNWAEVNGLMSTVVGGRYMDGLNQMALSGVTLVALVFIKLIPRLSVSRTRTSTGC